MRFLNVISLAIILFLIAGCAASNQSYGTFTQKRSVEQSFTKFQIPEGYNYYYSGRANIPDAIVGLRPGFTMKESQFWHPVDLDEEKMREWWSWLQHEWYYPGGVARERYLGGSLGWVITAPTGEDAGIMYSKYSRVTTSFLEGNVVAFSVPRPRYERRMLRRYDD